jgi:hypothetical protein
MSAFSVYCFFVWLMISGATQATVPTLLVMGAFLSMTLKQITFRLSTKLPAKSKVANLDFKKSVNQKIE